MNSKYFFGCIVCGALVQIGFGAKLDAFSVDQQISKYDTQISSASLKIINQPFDETFAFKMMRKIGFSPSGEREDAGSSKVYKSGRSCFIYDSKEGEYRFFNPDAEPLESSSPEVLVNILKNANDLLQSILPDSRKFIFVNDEFIWQEETVGKSPKVLLYKGFRFLRKEDGRLVLGNRCQIRFQLGSNGSIYYLSVKNPELQKSIALTKKISGKGAMRMLKDFAEAKVDINAGMSKVGLNQIRIKKMIRSYIPDNNGEGDVLIPNTTFLADYQLADNSVVETHISFSEDATLIPNLSTSEVQPNE